MEHILKDPKWKLVYADDTAVVFTDEDGYRDIREDKERLAALIKQESDYLSLMRLMSLYLKIQDNDLAGRAFMQATLRNGSSCAVKRILYQNDTDPLRDLKGGNIREDRGGASETAGRYHDALASICCIQSLAGCGNLFLPLILVMNLVFHGFFPLPDDRTGAVCPPA
jgi:hypothetical protein